MNIKIIPTEPRCGDCTVCCETLGFTGKWKITDIYDEAEKFDIDFGAWSTCNKLCETGCSIQENKPRVCEEFFCHFIEFNLEDKFRPKESGFVAFSDGTAHSDGTILIHSVDKTLPPDIQYNNNKQMLDELIDGIAKGLGKDYVYATLRTKQGNKRIR